MERTRIQLADGVYLTYLPARKFKTSLLSAQFVTPLQQETASAYALLPAVLRRGTVRYPGPGGACPPGWTGCTVPLWTTPSANRARISA